MSFILGSLSIFKFLSCVFMLIHNDIGKQKHNLTTSKWLCIPILDL